MTDTHATTEEAREGPARLAALASWGLLDQSLSSLTNVALGILVARASSPAEFGAFSLAISSYILALGTARALSSEPLVVRFGAASTARWREATAAAAGVALVVGLGAGAVCVVVGSIGGGIGGAVFVALGVLFPGLLLQDIWRFAFFAQGRGGAAFANDLVWAVVLLLAVLGLERAGRTSATWFVVAWGGSAAVAAVLGIRQAKVVPAPLRVKSWLHAHGDLAPRYLGEFAALTGAGQLVFYGIAAIGGLVAAGALRACRILLGPLNVLFLGLPLFAVPWGVRTLTSSVRRLHRLAVILSASLAAVSVALGGALYALPSGVGVQLLGRSWEYAQPLFLPLAIGMAALGLSLGPEVGLRSLAAAKRSLRARLLTSPLVVVGGLGGVAVGGVLAAAWGMAFGYGIGAAIWWRQFDAAVSEWSPEAEPEPSDETSSAVPAALALEGADGQAEWVGGRR